MAEFNFGIGRIFAALFGIIGLTILLLVVAQVLPDLISATGDTNEVLSNDNHTTNDTTADTVKAVMPIIVGVTVVFGVVALIIARVSDFL